MSDDSPDAYDLESVRLPYLTGPALRLFAAVLESSLGSLATGSLFKSAGITWLREQRIDDPPTMRPIHPAGAAGAAGAAGTGMARRHRPMWPNGCLRLSMPATVLSPR